MHGSTGGLRQECRSGRDCVVGGRAHLPKVAKHRGVTMLRGLLDISVRQERYINMDESGRQRSQEEGRKTVRCIGIHVMMG
jgi:hypothetical protein